LPRTACLCFAEREEQRAERPTKELESSEGATSADQAEAQEASRRLDEELMSSHWNIKDHAFVLANITE